MYYEQLLSVAKTQARLSMYFVFKELKVRNQSEFFVR